MQSQKEKVDSIYNNLYEIQKKSLELDNEILSTSTDLVNFATAVFVLLSFLLIGYFIYKILNLKKHGS